MDVKAVLVAVGMLGGGGYAAWLGAWQARRARQAVAWPETPGEVVTASTVEQRTRDGFRYAPAVRYRYQVDGRTFHADRIRYGSLGLDGSHSSAEAALIRYRQGAALVVRYNPADPSEAVLETDPGSDTKGLIGFGLAIAVLGTLLFWGGLT